MSEGRKEEGSERRETEGKKLGREGEKREEEGRVEIMRRREEEARGAALEFYISAKSLSEKKLIFVEDWLIAFSKKYILPQFFVCSRKDQILNICYKIVSCLRKVKTFCAFFSWAIDNNYRSTSYRRSLLYSVDGRKLL